MYLKNVKVNVLLGVKVRHQQSKLKKLERTTMNPECYNGVCSPPLGRDQQMAPEICVCMLLGERECVCVCVCSMSVCDVCCVCVCMCVPLAAPL